MNKIIISLPLFVTLAAAAIITTPLLPPVYAQSQACPEGFELNRGVCQAEPTPAQLGCEEGYELVDDMCRTLEPTRFHPAFCPSGYEIASYTHPEYGFASFCAPIGGHPPFDESELADPTCDTLVIAPNEVVVLENYERPVFAHETICAFYETAEPTPQGEPTCDIGSLNEESEMCEIRPGNRR